MPILEVTRAAKFVSLTNAGVFAGALITTVATLLSIQSNNSLQRLKDKAYAEDRMQYAHNRMEDQRKIGEANSRAEGADSKAQMLTANLDQALLRQKRLEATNLKLSTALQDEHQQRLSLETRLSPRHLSEDQMQIVARRLLPFSGTGIAFTRIQDQEASRFAEDFFRPLYLGGWHLTDNEVGIFAPPQFGVLLCVPTTLRTDPAALALANALYEARIGFSIQMVDGSELRLIVGLKPASS